MSDGVATSWHAVRRQAEVQPGQTVVIIGAGGLGVHATQITRLSGARTIAVDVVPEKLVLAQRFGADVTIDASGEDAIARVLEAAGLGAHYQPLPALPGIRIYPQPVRNAGQFIISGLPAGAHLTIFGADGNLITEVPGVKGNFFTWDATGMDNGIYYLQVISKNGQYIRKVYIIK